MIYNLVSSELKPGKLPEFSEFMPKEFMPLATKMGFNSPVSFHAYTGNMNMVYSLWVYDDLAAFQRIFADARKNPDFPKIMAKMSSMTNSQTYTLLEPNPWSPMK